MFPLVLVVLSCFAGSTFSNIQSNFSPPDIGHFREIIDIFNTKHDISRGTVLCDDETIFCAQICDVMQQMHIPVMVFMSKSNQTILFGKLNILHFQSDDNILSFMEEKKLKWTPDSYFVIFLNTRQVTKVLSTLWKNFKIRRAVLFLDTSSYRGSIYDVIYNEVKTMNMKNTTAQKLFQLRNLQGMRLRVTLFERMPEVIKIGDKLRGDNYRMMEMLSKKVNFTPLIQDSTDGKKFGDYANGVYTGGLGDIVYGRSDIAFNGYFLRKTNNNEYKYLFPVNMEYLCFVAPKAGKIPKYMVPFMCFPEDIWLALVISFVSVSACRYFMFYVRKKWFRVEENSNILLSLFSVTINIPISFTQYKHLSSRIILIIFLSQMYVIVTSFQGSLVTLLSIPKYYKDIETLAELNNSAFEIKTSSSTIVNVFKQDSALQTVANRIKKVKDGDFRNFNFTFFARILYHKRHIFRNFFIKKENRTYMVHRLKECPLLYYTSYIVSWNFPFIDEFNSNIMRTLEAGLMLKWDHEIRFAVMKTFEPQLKNNKNPSDEQLENRTFTLNDLEVAFIVLVVGYSCSICVFVWEICSTRK